MSPATATATVSHLAERPPLQLVQLPTDTRPASASRVVKTLLVVPAIVQHYGTLFGGALMAIIDEVATIAATRHAGCAAVTAEASVQFVSPVKVGEVVTVEAFVDWAGRTSMEVFVHLMAEDPTQGHSRLCGTAFLTFVGTDASRAPRTVPAVRPESELEEWLFAGAAERMANRRQARREAVAFGEFGGVWGTPRNGYR